jgi:uncharacterized Zn finger protein
MTRETTVAKSVRYLAEGRLTVVRVVGDEVRALARGGGQLYRCGHVAGKGGGWFCTCPARTDRCAHLEALRLVTIRRPT